MEELAELRHQTTPLILSSVVTEEAVQRGVERVGDLHLRPQSVDDITARARLGVEDGIGQWANRAPRPGQGVVIFHLEQIKVIWQLSAIEFKFRDVTRKCYSFWETLQHMFFYPNSFIFKKNHIYNSTPGDVSVIRVQRNLSTW